MLYAMLMICWTASACSVLHSEAGFTDRADCVEWIGLTIEHLQAPYEVRLVGCHKGDDA
jgi:hypothetical protein